MNEKRFTWDGDILFDSLELRELGNCLEARDIVDLLNEQQDIIIQQKETIDYMNERITELLAYIKHLKNGTEKVKEIDGKIVIKM